MRLKRLLFTFTFVFLGLAATAQMQVRGVIISAEDNEPIIGAAVAVKDAPSTGAVTNIDGEFSITVPSSKSSIVVSYLGMTTLTLPVKEGVMRIVMEPSAHEIGEVVVTGMQVMDKRLFTGASTKVDADKAMLGGMADISRSLEGRAAGVSVQNVSGTFGTAPKIRVRGATSIFGNSKPLWVVDGVVMEDVVEVSSDDLSSGDAITLISSAIAGLNADDIESFQILKDGSATSIYGARAMAGVIVITTKKGKAGQTSINYTGELTYRMKPRYSEFNILNSQEQMGVYKEMERKGWLEFASIARASNSGVYGKMYSLIDSYANGGYGLANTEAARNAYLREAEFRNTDWFNVLFNESLLQNHSISISGGTEKGRLYSSLSVMNDPGWTKSSSVERYTFNANASYDLTKKLRITLLTSDSYRKQRAPGTLSQETDAVSGTVKRNFDINPYSYALNTSRTLDPEETYTRNYTNFNIKKELDNNYIDLEVADLKFHGELNYRPVRGLELVLLGAYRHQNSKQNHYIKDDSNQANAYRAGIVPEDATIRDSNPYLYRDPDDDNALPETILPKGGIWFHSLYSVSQYDMRATAQYNAVFQETHIVNLFGGMELSSTDRHQEYFQGWGMSYDNGNVPYINYNLFKQQSEENTAYYSDVWTYRRNLAYFGTGTYSYLGRYTVNGTLRYEGSNKLGKARKSRWLPTWNLSAAWNAHEESWFQNPVLSHGTLKASYSLTAESGPAYVSNATAIYNPYKPWRPLTNAQELGLNLASLANSELTYEKKHEFNIGVDLGFARNRINLSGDYYVRDNFDLIGRIYTQGVGGQTLKFANVASMKSNGVEFTLSTKNVQTKDFSWTSDLTFAFAQNKITDLKSRSRAIDLVSGSGYALEGYPVRSLFSFQFVGLTEDGFPQFINEGGDVTIRNINFQEFERLNHLVYEGPTDPTTTGGFGNMFTYKGFRLNLFLTYSFGNKIRLNPVFAAGYSDLSALPKEFKNRWTLPGDELHTNIPVIASTRQVGTISQLSIAYNAYNYSTERIADGGFVRLKEISLMYDLPKEFLSYLHIKSASVKLQATNLVLLYADKKLNGQDPEFYNSGGVATPSPKQFTFTLRLGL